jgi:hypothetical protein
MFLPHRKHAALLLETPLDAELIKKTTPSQYTKIYVS